MLSTTHLAISDASGDSAIFESIEGRLVIHHGRQFQVMTNSPAYDQQLALNDYWRQMGGTVMMPGTSRSADRFVRASFYLNAVQRTADASEAVACAFSVIRSVSTPLGFPTPAQPNLAPTHWRSVSDHKNRRYYFESARGLDLFWVDLADLDFKAAAPARRLDLMHGAVYAGNAAARFQPAEPFPFQSAGNGPPLLGSPDQTALPSPRQGAGSVAAWGVFASGIAGR
jgi:choloylglycine hydrolase